MVASERLAVVLLQSEVEHYKSRLAEYGVASDLSAVQVGVETRRGKQACLPSHRVSAADVTLRYVGVCLRRS